MPSPAKGCSAVKHLACVQEQLQAALLTVKSALVQPGDDTRGQSTSTGYLQGQNPRLQVTPCKLGLSYQCTLLGPGTKVTR
jgi:hypothetical protein